MPASPPPATSHDAAIEVDPAMEVDDGDSSYTSSGVATDTASLSSSVYAYVFENGRRYQAYFGEDKTFAPNDETEQDRLDLHHEIFLDMLEGELHLAPIDPAPQRILDLGTGTGIWAIDAADKYPSAQVLGTDLSPIQPKWVPTNCRFEVDDMEAGLLFPDDHFDFVHIRNLAQSIADWDQLLAEVYRVLKPGGWIELSELGCVTHCDDGSMADDNGTKIFMETLDKCLAKIGRPWPVENTLGDRLKASGFTAVESAKRKQPSGPWPKDPTKKRIGLMTLLGSDTGYEAYGLAAFTRILGMDKDEAKEMCRAALAAAKNKRNHTYSYFFLAYGQKPEKA